jgi:hypothetical protein
MLIQILNDYVAYCFAEKQGYSKFGKYVGNGSADGPFVYTGFKPAFLIIKNTAAGGNWVMFDTKRELKTMIQKQDFSKVFQMQITPQETI